MRDTLPPFRAGFARQPQVGKSAGHQLASPADLPIKVSLLAKDTYRLDISRDFLLPAHSSVCEEAKSRKSGIVLYIGLNVFR